MPKRVAVVGLSFRFPSTDSRRYWSDLLESKDLVTEVQADRWSRQAYLHPAKEHPGTSYTFAAGSIGDISGFDADFFGISPREAAQMDPQQRLLMELCWEAIESSGTKPSALRGSDCGVYIGIASADYSYRLSEDFNALESSFATGNTASIAANRLSYVFDLHGPSMAIDTACSSALVAFHQACQAIGNGEISHAIAGGVSLHLHPYGFVTFSKASMLSPQGRCRVFDASGDGYVRSEGGGLFLLKGYDQALADGDPILAVVAGTAVNTDGRKSGLTVPNPAAQIDLMRRVYAQAGIDPAQIDYLEAHGTGTAVGDPIEARAIGLALGQARDPESPLPIGSVKSNLGHLEAASGVAGLVKAIYSLQHRTVPATIGISTLNPNIAFDELNIEVVTRTRRLKPDGTLTIGVNSFGFGGANAHAILQTPAPVAAAHAAELTNTAAIPVVVTGRTQAALRESARSLAGVLRSQPGRALYDIAYHSAMRRDWHEERTVVFGTDSEAVAQVLEQFANGQEQKHLLCTGTRVVAARGPIFIYSGNGSQWPGMGRRLMSDAVFAEALHEIDTLFAQYADWSLAEELRRTDSTNRYDLTEISQPALFAVQVGVTRMLAQRGIQPVAVVGHSVGEVAAAWACGALTLADAVAVIFHRSRLQGTTKGRGRMAAVGMDAATAAALLAELDVQDNVCVAAANSPRGATLAGDLAALELVGSVLAEQRQFYRQLDLDYAFHSDAMDGLEVPLLQSLAGLRPQQAHVPFYSTVAGRQIEGTDLDAAYWWRNIRQPVRFQDAIASLVDQGYNVYAEIGPHPVLRSYVNDALKAADRSGRVAVTVTRGDDEPAKVRDAASQVMLSGAQVDWPFLFPWMGRHIALPAYPWQRERHWHAVTAESLGQLQRRPVHPLLGYAMPQRENTWENQVDTQVLPWLADHVVGGATVFPGSGYAELALAAAQQWQPGPWTDIEELEIHTPLLVDAAPSKLVRLAIDNADGRLSISAKDVGSTTAWTVHASGRLLTEARGQLLNTPCPPVPETEPDFTGASHLALTQAAGLSYGPSFQAVSHGWIQSRTAVTAVLEPPAALSASLDDSLLHPALLDCTFQLIVQTLKNDAVQAEGIVYVPSKIGRLSWRKDAGLPHLVHARLLGRSPHSLTAEFFIFDAQQRQIAALHGVRFRSFRLARAAADQLDFLDYACIPCPHPDTRPEVSLALTAQPLLAALREAAGQAAADGLMRRYTNEVDPLLDSLCDRYASQALHALSKNGRLSADVLRACHEAAPQAAGLLDCLVARAELAGTLQRAGAAGWKIVPASADEPGTADIWNSLLVDYPDYFPAIHAAGCIGQNLPALLRGETALEAVIPRDVSPAALWRRILGPTIAQRLGSVLGACVEQAQGDRGAGQRIAVTEIAASPPLFARALCAAMDFSVCDYTYVTPSSAALDEAMRLRESHPHMAVHLLEDTQPGPAAQADLVIFHCDFDSPQSAQQALQHARDCLKPGGTLLLRGTHPAAWMDFVFGAGPAWWAEGADRTRTSPQYPAVHWQTLLDQLGLCGGTMLEFGPEASSGPYLIAATRPQAEPVQPSSSPDLPQGCWLLLADAGRTPGRRLADRLAAGLADRKLPARVIDMRADQDLRTLLSQTPREQIQGIVHLAGMTDGAAAASPRQLLDVQVERCALTAELARACEQLGISSTIWLLTQDAAPFRPPTALRPDAYAALNDAALWHYGRTLMNEASGFSVRLVDLANATDAPLEALLRELLAPDAEQEIALDAAGARYAPRLRRNPRPGVTASLPDQHDAVRLGFEFPGQLRNLRWERHTLAAPKDDEIVVRIKATGLNFRDVMYALGLLSDEAVENGFAGATLGLEFSGIVEHAGAAVTGYRAGDAVVGFGPASFGDRILTQASALAHIPDGISYEAAATIPSTFFTVYYALHHLARLEEGEAILVHGAAGGVGIAAIQYAQWRGAEIHATAGSDEKRNFLRMLGVKHIYDSRALTYADEILARTGGKGVDVVLNSLAGEAVNRNFQVLKPLGRFLELGKRDFYENTRIGLRPFRNNISYFGIDADQLMRERPALTHRLFSEVMDLFQSGVLHPLPYHLFDANDVVDAFRYMQQARQIGKIVVTYEAGIRDVRMPAADLPALSLAPDGTYLVTGGLSGFGLRTAQWLADRGARHLVLVGRQGLTEGSETAVEALRMRGVSVHAAACDVTDRQAVERLLAYANDNMPPLHGVVHAAMVIDDGLIRGASAAQIERVLAPKVLGAMHLDALTRSQPLDFFILFSSGTTLFGNPGQASYVAANGWLEALARQRRALGLPATCVRWGAIDDVGYLARNTRTKDALQSRMGGKALPSELALQVLEELLVADATDLGVLELDWRALARFLPTAGTPKFSWMTHNAMVNEPGDAGAGIDQLLATLDDDELHPIIIDMLKVEVGTILRMPADKLDAERSVYDMGLDSLMGVELVVALESRFGVRLSAMALSEAPTLSRLSRRLIELLRGKDSTASDPLAVEVAQVVAQHVDNEVSSAAVEEFRDELAEHSQLPKQRMIH